MTSLLYIAGILIFVVSILVSIGLHELGHMIPAKAFGGKVTQYFIGFGPTVWSRRRGETEYGVKAIPLGGYVKIVGMLPPGAEQLGTVEYDDQGNQVTRIRKSNTGIFTQLISDARAAEWELITPADDERLFYKMAWWKKVVVMAGGPSVNIAIAFFLFWTVFATYGNPTDDAVDSGAPVISSVNKCVIPASEQRTACEAGDQLSPAFEAGLRPGDTITSFNGTAITSYDQLQELIRANKDGRAEIGYERDGTAYTTTTSTLLQDRPVDTDHPDQLESVGFLGVAPTTHRVTGGPLYTLVQMGYTAEQTVEAMVRLPERVWGVAKAIVGVQDRDPESPVSIVGGSRIAGETASATWLPNDAKITFLLLLVAGFNFFIGAFNFIPLLPLDGGHIASALWEAVRRGLAKLRGLPDPGFVDAAKLLPIAYVMASAMLVMSLVLIVGDLVVPIHITG
ncbi:site-2 protease family protein [Nocardioides anomalus]|uniref:Site-2 protease family protein n=1 Tax=Nocardioides anomalus TaxID=2712223 RepID=A0A6G6WB05_9ACTN|nr:site-2 protease family protein [Nocardioides anomalus]QIG42396.1 site-2 protease family protein [Nocardioides anomalus]